MTIFSNFDISSTRLLLNGQSTFKYSGEEDWNSLPPIFGEVTSITSFKRSIYMYLLDSDKDSHICSL